MDNILHEGMTPKERVEAMLHLDTSKEIRFVTPLYRDGNLKLLEASSDGPTHARTLWEFSNPHYWANQLNIMHGGAHATIYDCLTSASLAVIARPGFYMYMGVSRTLSVSYLRGAKSDEPVLIECEVVHAGQRLALSRATMRRKSDGEVLSVCEHNKINSDPPAPKL
ncbi:hypothetical protein ANO11243_008100 [Dothideomycetidae sp. 11243]|nr:hypothetical protein ANO11243_008100 [fungal sp. No.11243]